jgi:hypothetical protein
VSMKRFCLAFSVIAAVALLQVVMISAAQAGPVYPHLYVAVDDRQTIPSGTYAGLTNPNANRLSFLYAHSYDNPASNHFHGIGLYSYTGPNLGASTAVTDTSTNNTIPEPSYLGTDPTKALQLTAGTGAYAGRLATSLSETAGNTFDGTAIRFYATLNNTGNQGEQVLYNSGQPRYRSSLVNGAGLGLNILVELVSITPGLTVGDANGNAILSNVGDTFSIGTGDSISFNPVFFTDLNAAPGMYSAEFRLRDANEASTPVADRVLQSGRFGFAAAVTVPEPGTFALFAIVGGAVGGGIIRRRMKAA